MKHLFILLLSIPLFLNAQSQQQYFDGADTSIYNSVLIDFGTDSNNIWQIGRPQKVIFDTAATFPNALLTDTINYYPINDTSIISLNLKLDQGIDYGVYSVQWMQKIDFDSTGNDGGIIEYSIDSGITWSNVYNDPNIYENYGYIAENIDTIYDNEVGFVNTDTVWRNIWVCFNASWANIQPSLKMRFKFVSDSIASNNEGWMIDNLMTHISIAHTTVEVDQTEYINIYPNPSQEKLFIDIKKEFDFHIIESLNIVSFSGETIETHKNVPTNFFIDIKDYPAGIYFLKIQTNKKSETIKFEVSHP